MRTRGFFRMPLLAATAGLGLFPALSLVLPACIAPAAEELKFEKHEVETGAAARQTLLTGFLLGGAVADLATVEIDEQGIRRLRIFTLGKDAWVAASDATLHPEVRFVDVAGIGGRDRLIAYEPGRLTWFDPGSEAQHELLKVTTDYLPPREGEVPHVDITRDVNGDGRDDLVVPYAHGFQIFVQTGAGTFADPVKIGPSTGMERIYPEYGYRHDPWASSGRIHEVDHDRDGRTDLVFWNQDHFEVHHQNEQGRFPGTARRFTTEVTFDSDELDFLAAPRGVRRRKRDHNPPGSMTGKVLHSLSDMNGDGVGDLVVFSLAGGGLLSMESSYEIHFGTPVTGGGTRFEAEVGAALRADGIPFTVEPHDFNGDGQVDLMFAAINPGLFKAVGMLLSSIFTKSVSQELEVYRMVEGSYAEKPVASSKIKTRIPPREEGRNTLFPAVLTGDVTGDGRSELLVQNGANELRVFIGEEGSDLIARRPRKVKISLPRHLEYVWLVDLDRDGKQDVLIHNPSTTGPHRVTILMAR